MPNRSRMLVHSGRILHLRLSGAASAIVAVIVELPSERLPKIAVHMLR
jgi:hypothetical protein